MDDHHYHDRLYVKFAGQASAVSLPFCEVLDGEILPGSSTPDNYVVRYRKRDAPAQLLELKASKPELIAAVQRALALGTVEDCIIQPKGMATTREVQAFRKLHKATT